MRAGGDGGDDVSVRNILFPLLSDKTGRNIMQECRIVGTDFPTDGSADIAAVIDSSPTHSTYTASLADAGFAVFLFSRSITKPCPQQDPAQYQEKCQALNLERLELNLNISYDLRQHLIYICPTYENKPYQ